MNLEVTVGASIHLVTLGITDHVTIPNRIIQTTSSLCKAGMRMLQLNMADYVRHIRISKSNKKN